MGLTTGATGAPATPTLQSQQEFDPWGLVRSGGVGQTRRNFTGQYLDETGLLFYNARYYDPVLGRFVSSDTIVPGADGMEGIAYKPLTVGFASATFLAALNDENRQPFWYELSADERQDVGSPWGPENPQSLNRYAYVLNNPLKYTDPTGHCPICRFLSPLLKAIGQAISQFGKWISGVFRPNPALITGASKAGAAIVNNVKFGTRSLQHAYGRGHAADFGVTGNWNKANAALFEQVLRNHMSSSSTIITTGTYRGQQVYHFFDPKTSLWATTDLNGNFIAAWRLSQAQIKHLLTSGNIN